jgi:hypothetical protein
VLTDPAHQIVVVNPVTTLVSLVRDARPNLKLDGAEARVRSFLGLPANYSLGMALRESSHYASRRFSPIALLTEAQAAGGLDAFEHLLAQELLASPGATHSFHNSKPKAPGDGTTSFEEDLALAALQAAGGQGAGWVMAQTGLVTPGITSAEIDALIQELSDLQSSIDALSKLQCHLPGAGTSCNLPGGLRRLFRLASGSAQPVHLAELGKTCAFLIKRVRLAGLAYPRNADHQQRHQRRRYFQSRIFQYGCLRLRRLEFHL